MSGGRTLDGAHHRFALVAGGGTAGHLQPALAMAEALVAAGHAPDDIEFVGSTRGQDRQALCGRGFPLTLLPGRGIVRRPSLRDAAGNVVAAVELVRAVATALRLVRRTRPRVVVSVGGYASVAAAAAAVILRVPLVLVNVDAVPGAANRLFGRFARASAVGWPGTPLPRSVVTGTPVRPAISAVSRDGPGRRAARRDLGLPEDRPTVCVFGGSLGARRINEAVAGVVTLWHDRSDRTVYQVVGHRDWSDLPAPPPEPQPHQQPEPHQQPAPHQAPGIAVTRVAYEERMDLLYAAADVIVCRAGAMTVAELAASGCPSVLVPLPGAPGDHQTANARVLEAAGAARILPDARCDGPTLAALLDELLADAPGLEAMERAAASLRRPDAAAAGARLVEAQAQGEGRPTAPPVVGQ